MLDILFSTVQQQIDTAKSQTGGQGDINSAVGTALNVVYGIIGVVAVVMIIIGGVSYSTSQGDPSRLKKARGTILYGIIGLVVALLAFTITGFILKSI